MFLASEENDTPSEETTNDVFRVAEVVEDDASLSSFLTLPTRTTLAPPSLPK